MSGTYGKAKRLEAIQIKLTGEIANHYDIYYRVHAQSYGWLDWAKNGENSGTAGYAKRLEAIQIVLVPKNNLCPSYKYKNVRSNSIYSYVSTSCMVKGNSIEDEDEITDPKGVHAYWENEHKKNNGCNHEFETIKSIEGYMLVVDPSVEPNMFSRPLGGYCFTIDDDPYGGASFYHSLGGGIKTVHEGTYYIGDMVNDHIFRTTDGEDIDLNSLDWYCIHLYEYSTQDVCKKCGYYKNCIITSDGPAATCWYGIENNDENCTCFEFARKQYGVIFIPKDHDASNSIDIPYSRCKHENMEPYEFESVNLSDDIWIDSSKEYVRCKDCGAIFLKSDLEDK